jgi:hypothetical protein
MAIDVIAQYSNKGPQPWVPEDISPADARLTYDEESDSLGLMFGHERAGSVSRRPGGIWWRIDSKTGEVYGIEIQAFAHKFLPRVLADAEVDSVLRMRLEHHWHAFKEDPTAPSNFAEHILMHIGFLKGRSSTSLSRP